MQEIGHFVTTLFVLSGSKVTMLPVTTHWCMFVWFLWGTYQNTGGIRAYDYTVSDAAILTIGVKVRHWFSNVFLCLFNYLCHDKSQQQESGFLFSVQTSMTTVCMVFRLYLSPGSYLSILESVHQVAVNAGIWSLPDTSPLDQHWEANPKSFRSWAQSTWPRAPSIWVVSLQTL